MFKPELIQAIPTNEYKVYLYFSDGKVRLYDAKSLIDKGGIFTQLKDLDIFINTCTIMNDTLAWDVAGNYNIYECIDICPDTLLTCPIVENIETIEQKLFA